MTPAPVNQKNSKREHCGSRTLPATAIEDRRMNAAGWLVGLLFALVIAGLQAMLVLTEI